VFSLFRLRVSYQLDHASLRHVERSVRISRTRTAEPCSRYLCAKALIFGYFSFRTNASSRSKARCRGFWQVTPSCARSRPTETRLNVILNLSLLYLAIISRVHNAKSNFICGGFFCVMVSKIHFRARPSDARTKASPSTRPSPRVDTAPSHP
jgi:hypothetical protein